MKRLGVAGIIFSEGRLLLGRRGKDPNRGRYVLPGGGVEDGESLDQAFCREILEETGLVIPPDDGHRWTRPTWVIELSDRVILVAHVAIKGNAPLRDGSDLYEVTWWDVLKLPSDLSPVIVPALAKWGFIHEPE